MHIMIISANPLFREVLHEITSTASFDSIELEPDDALPAIEKERPDILIIDEMILPPLLREIFCNERRRRMTRAVILNHQQNEIVLLDACKRTLRKSDDLINTLVMSTHMFGKDTSGSTLSFLFNDSGGEH